MYPFLNKTLITDLGFGAGFTLWGFRAMASGCGGCKTMRSGFQKAFSSDNRALQMTDGEPIGLPAMKALAELCRLIGTLGRRKIVLSSSGSMRLTADELSLVAALSAAQAGDSNLCQTHLLWLLGTSDTEPSYQAAVTYGLICAEAGIFIHEPKIETSPPNIIEKVALESIEPLWCRSDRVH